MQTFHFIDANRDVNNPLQIIPYMVLKFVPVAYPVFPHVQCHMQSIMECYNMSGKPKYDDELQNINVLETEGSKDGATPDVPTDPMS